MTELLEASYSWRERERDRIERDLFEKPQIHQEMRHGLEITVYYLRKVGQVSLSLSESGQLREFIIPNEEVNDCIEHPEWAANRAGMPRPRGVTNE